MQNRPRPSIAQNSRKPRSKSEGPDTGKVQLTLPGKSPAAEPPRPPVNLKSPEPALPTPPPPVEPGQLAPPAVEAVTPIAAAPVAIPAAPAPLVAPISSAPTDFSPAAPPVGDSDFQLPAGFKPRAKQGMDRPINTRNTSGGNRWLTLATPAMLLVGGLVGYLVGVKSHPAPLITATPKTTAADAPVTEIKPISAEMQAALDAAFDAAKATKYDSARAQLVAILEKRPDWTSLRFEIARMALYQRDYVTCEKLIQAGENSGEISVADGEFLLALQQMTNKRYQLANKGYERAAAADPARADIYYFWGECLRRQGKPNEASAKLRAALSRNQYETSDTLYQLKLWLSEIQAGEEVNSGLAAKLDAEMAEPTPSSAVLMASAARAIKAGQFPQAAAALGRARQVLDSPVFNVVIQDPTFSQESWRPEFAGFYPKPVPAPAAPAPETKAPDAKAAEAKAAEAKAQEAKASAAPSASAAPTASPAASTLSIKTLDPKAEVPPPLAVPELGGQVPPKP